MGGVSNGSKGKNLDGRVGAMELIVDPATGAVTSADARAIVLRYLASQEDRKSCDLSVDEFPGYHTTDLSKDGEIAGMASVKASTGEIYFRDWESSSVTR